jgi:hypothetical protein
VLRRDDARPDAQGVVEDSGSRLVAGGFEGEEVCGHGAAGAWPYTGRVWRVRAGSGDHRIAFEGVGSPKIRTVVAEA